MFTIAKSSFTDGGDEPQLLPSCPYDESPRVVDQVE
jgi:hypothetical protein